MSEKKQDIVAHNWDTFWKDIVCNPDGSINIEQLKKELSDFSFVMEQVPKVYCHITGDTMSYLTYKAEDVIRVADDYFNQQLREAIDEELEEQPQPGARWVKAMSKFPGWGNPVRWRLDGVERMVCDVYYLMQAESPAHIGEYEWLDESGAEPAKESDAVAFAMWFFESPFTSCIDRTFYDASKDEYFTMCQLYEKFKKEAGNEG